VLRKLRRRQAFVPAVEVIAVGFLSPTKLLLIIALLLLLFGAGRIASLGKGLGEGIRNFRKGLRGGDDRGPDDESGNDKQLKG
jgi:sec-independent protein translocase protein TatA